LLARIRAVLRRANAAPPGERDLAPTTRRLAFDRWIFDTERRELIDAKGVTVPLSTAEYRLLTAFVKRPGLVLSRDKVYLLESRLLPVARKWQIRGLPELAEAIRTRREEALIRDVTEAMTTNESSFYRDQKPFELFRSFVLPTLMKTRAGGRRLRIWSAACSTGQEPYSLAMILHEERAKLAGWSFEILGTDLSHDVLERARAAAGSILVAGGLGGLALLPKAEVALTVPPQLLIGVGLSLVLSALTETALAGRAPQAIHGGWTISARHAGVAVGLILLTPLFTAQIADQRRDAIDAGTAVVLDSRVQPLLKLELAQKLEDRLEGEQGKVPTIGPAFEPLPEDPDDREDVLTLRDELQDQLDRAATHAFSPSFGLGALLGLLALIPIGLARRIDL